MYNCFVKKSLFSVGKSEVVTCLACKRSCIIKNGNVGVCGVRENENGKLKLLVYGSLNAVNIDPIEKKPIFHMLPGSQIFSVGTVGCNFFCSFCQNWQSSQVLRDNKGKDVMKQYSGYKLSPKQAVNFCFENNIPAIAFTYNEPTIFAEYSHDVMEESIVAGKRKLLGVYVTNGYFTKYLLDYMDGLLDAMNIDLKAFSERFYNKYCGAKLNEVLDGIEMAFKKGIWIELTTMLIPGENDSSDELKKAARFISNLSKNIPWHITAFHPEYKMTDKSPTSVESIRGAVDIGRAEGLKFIYGGNISDPDLESTHCSKCNKLLIRRSWVDVEVVGMEDGRCKYCGTKIPGIWDSQDYLSKVKV